VVSTIRCIAVTTAASKLSNFRTLKLLLSSRRYRNLS